MTGSGSHRPPRFPGDKEALTREAFVGQPTAEDSLPRRDKSLCGWVAGVIILAFRNGAAADPTWAWSFEIACG